MAHISEKGLRLIMNYEGLRLQAYQDSGGIWTIGYGHTGPAVHQGMVITKTQAEDWLQQDVQKFEDVVQSAITKAASQDQFDALVSFAYNIGEQAFRSSTLLVAFNAGDIVEVVWQFRRWVTDGHQILPGLVRRRKAEARRFLGV